jgi:hypothetical protein
MGLKAKSGGVMHAGLYSVVFGALIALGKFLSCGMVWKGRQMPAGGLALSGMCDCLALAFIIAGAGILVLAAIMRSSVD